MTTLFHVFAVAAPAKRAAAEVGPCALVQTPFTRPDFGDSNCAEYLNLPLSSPPNCSEGSTRVPRIYHAVGGSAERPSNVAMNAAVHLDGFVVNYHDDESAFEYVTKHCGREAGQAYRCLLAPAFRADLFRFCALSAEGGVYLDTDLVLLKPIASVVDMCDAGATIGRDISGADERKQMILASVPSHPLPRCMLDSILRNVRQRFVPPKGRPLMLTGPELLDWCYNQTAGNDVAITYRDSVRATYPHSGMVGVGGLVAFEQPNDMDYIYTDECTLSVPPSDAAATPPQMAKTASTQGGRHITTGISPSISHSEQQSWCMLNGLGPNCTTTPQLVKLVKQAQSPMPPISGWMKNDPAVPLPRLQLLRPPAQPNEEINICYVHVNKAGGLSGIKAFRKFQDAGMINQLVELHGLEPGESSPRTGKKGSTNWFSQWSAPMSPNACTIGGFQEGVHPGITMAFKVVLWVRDPITRVISSWNFLRTKPRADAWGDQMQAEAREWDYMRNYMQHTLKMNMSTSFHGSGFAEAVAAAHAAGGLAELIMNLGHARATLARYLFEGDGSMASASRIAFVGRVEAFGEDWARLVDLLGLTKQYQGRPSLKPPQTHSTARGGSLLSGTSVLALRKALSLSYASIWWLQSNGLLPVGYYETITSREDYED
ncbi:hypothetical protein EMIHUDRAFT_252938 [Emiliania huxleyi CCMP1516]|uniref:Alpha 1,4-glycosyltransferase domain-containing protein n=2 Tax=Emiliania huxleyi TaxID=2903 RepID=A0A0D3KEA9_EMIH1|nr:hypothetical protein EMIHUDRAFT_252938 [Emiliania huxleyi CCMP1516]EOD34094.1 hypothetical protein EMIHUDRAFT_252938 [Emiliania huxleyi CCMP1516]|eukprot:XP_005786523.1 hypothetical protein EMIHUDRAFT_252938 [Emiliania huxleyi CCMP1516]